MVVQMRPARSYYIVSFLILILIGQTYGVFGQTVPLANHVVINEADINPPGDDTKYPIDWVELYNPTNSPVNIGGWTIGATSGLRQTLTIPDGITISSKQFLIYTYGPLWFPHAGATIQLKSKDGTVVDQTPPLTDFQGDANSWQRIYDGYNNTGTISDWVFKLATPGSSNGQPPVATTTSQTTMTLAIDKPSYIFGDTVMMSGTVSKLATDPVLGYPLTVNLVVTGPSGFHKTFTLYPNNNLQFSTSMKTDQVLGFAEGSYAISASYGTATASATFALGSTAFTPPPQTAPITMSVSTDKTSYTTSETITLSGTVSQVIPLTSVTYKVYDPSGTIIYQGSLFPDQQGIFTTYNPYQSHSSASGIMINAITPVYGVYKIIASYGTTTATTSFSVMPKSQQSAPIVVSTDKQVYGLGDTVTITGSTQLSGLQNSALSPGLEIIQAYSTSSIPQSLDIKTFVNVNADNSFTYKFPVSTDPARLGNYRVIISLPTYTAETDFVVAQNPASYQVSQTVPFSITTDKSFYGYGDSIVISGKVQTASIVGTGAQIQISVFNSSGNQIYSATNPQGSGAVISQLTPLTYFALPDSNGNYLVKQTITPNIFTTGNYTLKATYNNLKTSTTFSVYNSLGMSNQTPIIANTDKQVYGLGDTVHLTGKISSFTGTSSYTLNLVTPSGGLITFPLTLSNGLFSWDWTIPTSGSSGYSSIINTNRGSVVTINPTQNLYGIYSIIIHSDSGNSQLFFQVSRNPQSLTQISPFDVETDKTNYSTTEVLYLTGQVLPQANTASQIQNTQAQVVIYSSMGQEVYRSYSNVNNGGQFSLSIPLHPIIWPTGIYKIYAQYLTYNSQISFNVTDLFSSGNSTKLQVFITTDHTKYLPGQTVLITGRTSSIIALPNTYLTFGLANDTIISEGQVVSQHGYTLHTATAPFDQYGSFSYDYVIPKGTPTGNYTVIAQVPFGVFNAYYQVVSQLPPQNIVPLGNLTSQGNVTQVIPTPANVTQTPTELTIIPTSIGPIQKAASSTTILDKQGMLTGTAIPITVGDKTVGNSTYYPREIDGLLRVNPSDVNTVTLKLSSSDGTCVIGPDPGCKISQSTSQGGSLYQIVKLGNENFFVGFTGPGQRLQQFSLVPTNANDVIPSGQWNVDVIKQDQVSRLYYQVTYISK
jgi:Lamin Tail Domain